MRKLPYQPYDDEDYEVMNNIIKASNGTITTYSKVVAFSVAVTHDALANYKDDNNDMEGGKN